MLVSGVVLGAGCTHLQWEPVDSAGAAVPAGPMTSEDAATGPGALVWWSRAIEAHPAARESMLRSARQAKSAWRVAMLRSLPGSPESETAEASQDALRAQLRRGLRDEEAAVTRIRIAELGQSMACHSDNIALRARLNRIIEIEKEMGNGR